MTQHMEELSLFELEQVAGGASTPAKPPAKPPQGITIRPPNRR